MDKKRILRKQTIKEAAIIFFVIAFLSKILGYVRDMLTAKYFGTSPQMDAFEVALIIPNMILGLFATGAQTIIIRLYGEKREENKEKILVNQIFFIYSVVLMVLTLLLILFSPLFVKLVASGFTSLRLSYASNFVKVLAIFGYLNVMTGFLTGVFQAEEQFFYPALAGLIANSVIPVSLLLLTPSIGIYSRVLGQDFFGLVYFFMLFSFLFFRWKFFRTYNLKNIDWPLIKEFTNLMLPAIVISGSSVIYQIIDKTVASYLPYGAIASLSYAQTVFFIPYSLIAVPITTAVYPTLSQHAISNNSESYMRLFKKAFFVLVFVNIPFTVFFVMWASPIVRVIFQRGAFNEQSVLLTQANVSMYSLGLLGISLADLFRRAFFSFKDTKTPMRISLVSVVLNLVFDIVFTKFMGAPGIALATTLVTYISLFQYILYGRGKNYFERDFINYLAKETGKGLLSGLFIGVLAYFMNFFIPLKEYALKVFFISIGFGAILFIIYVVVGLLLNSEMLKVALNYTLNFLSNVKESLGGKK